MSEPTEGQEPRNKTLDVEKLKQQASELRQSSDVPDQESVRVPSRVGQVVYLAILVLIVASVVFLLASGQSRRRLLRGLGEVWGRVSQQEQGAEVFKLPPPPPKTVEPKVVLQGDPNFAYTAGPIQQGAAEDEEGGSTEEESGPPQPPEKTAGNQQAFEFLVKQSEVAQKLSSGGYPDLTFKEWRPVRNNPPEFWVDLVASRASGQEAHFIWSVNIESQTVNPLSQDARDLGRK